MMGKPKIRFKGYNEDWEQRKFSELYAKSSEKNDGSIGMDKNITVATMQFKENVKVSTAEYLKTYYTFNLGDIAFEGHQSKEFRYGRFVENDIGNGIVSHIFAVFRPIREYDLYFWKYAINNETLMQRILSRSTKASTMMHDLVTKDFLNEMFLVPSFDEQRQIGVFLATLDHLITLHHRKCVVLRKMKVNDWEQRKLDDWGNFYYGRSCPKWSVAEDATIPCIRYGELYTKFGAKIDKIYSYTNMSPENLRFSNGTEVLIPRVGEDPMDYNRCTWLSMPNVAIGEMISVFNTDNNPLFTATMFNATLQHEFAMRVEGGSVTNLYFDKLKNIEVSFPTKEEQEKIATYFDHLDHLITLHHRECVILRKMKVNDWEQRKLGDIAEVTKLAGFEFTEHVVYSDAGNIIALRGLNIKNGQLILDDVKYIDGSNFSKLNRSKLFIDDIMLTYVGTVGEVAIIKENNRFYLAPNVSRIRVQSNDSPKFISHYMRTDNFKNKVIFPLIATSSQPALSMENIRKFMINMPKNRDEQDCLAEYFDHLDHLITLHQHKCDELQNLKKYMLQNMFV